MLVKKPTTKTQKPNQFILKPFFGVILLYISIFAYPNTLWGHCIDYFMSLLSSLVLSNNIYIHIYFTKKKQTKPTTFNGGSLGSCIDEERCELRYVMRIAQLSESSNLWTQIALRQQCRSMPGRVSFPNSQPQTFSFKPKTFDWSMLLSLRYWIK